MRCPNCSFQGHDNINFCSNCGHALESSEECSEELSSVTMPSGVSSSPGFVGRQFELENLTTALGDALEGRGRIVMLAGEPGIGKTRLAEELTAMAESRGVRVLWGRCYEEQGVPPYWPWVQAIRTYVRDRASDELRKEMGQGAVDIAELVSDVRDLFPEIPTPAVVEPEQARFKLFDSISTFLKNVSHQQPLMIVFDDLHWSDRPSLLLLNFIAKELRGSSLLLVGAYRDVELNRRHPLAQILGELTRERSFKRIALRGLSSEHIGRFMEVASGISPPRGLEEAVYGQTEGNPFFVTEVVQLLVQEGELTSNAINRPESWTTRIPEGVREVIGRRLDKLTERCSEVLTVASVIGRNFSFNQLDKFIETVSQDDLLDTLEEAVLARMIEESPNEMGSYHFTHALIQETLSEELSLTRRTRLHARIAESLEELYSAEAETYAAELAYHFAQAELVLGTDKLVKYSIASGEQAISSHAYEDALFQFQRALTAKEGSLVAAGGGQVLDDQTATILFGLGRAQVATFTRAQAKDALDTLMRAFEVFIHLGDTKRAIAVATYPHGFLRSSSGTANMASRALDLVSANSTEEGYLLVRYGAALSWENQDYEGAKENLNRAVEIARFKEDSVLEVKARFFLATMHYFQEHYRETIEEIVPVIELAQSLAEGGTLAHAGIIYANALLSIGDGLESQVHATIGLEAAERLHNSSMLVGLLRHNAYLAALRGEWKVAKEFVARALAELPGDITALADGALLNLQVGDEEESNGYIDQVLKLVSNGLVGAGIEQASAAVVIPLFARVTDTIELLDIAESVARDVLSSASLPSIDINRANAGLAFVAIQRGDAESAKELYSILHIRRHTQSFALFCYDRLLGLLAQTMGSFEDAKGHFEDALEFCRKASYRSELAWSLCDYAELQLAQGEHNKAIVLLEESFAIATELGMRPLVKKASALREQAGSQPARYPSYPDGLTEREVEVLRLVAQGMTNPEIAEKLFISPRTVTTHVSNILNKTNSANRAEASTYASRHEIL